MLYTPNVGDRVKLRTFEQYLQLRQPIVQRAQAEADASVRAGFLSEQDAERIMAGVHESLPAVWAWFRVLSIDGNSVELQPLNGAVDKGPAVTVPLAQIAPPIGWQPVYEIVCRDRAQAETVINSWFDRGITVWANHDMSSSGGMAFTPCKGDVEAVSPNWRYTDSPVEIIEPDECKKRFAVKVLKQWEPQLPPTSEKWARQKAIKAIKGQADITLHFVPDGFGGRMALCESVETLYEPEKEA